MFHSFFNQKLLTFSDCDNLGHCHWCKVIFSSAKKNKTVIIFPLLKLIRFSRISPLIGGIMSGC